MEQLQIRALVPADAALFSALRLRGLRECPEAFASSFEEESATPVGEIEARLAQEGVVFGAFEAGALRGLLGLRREGQRKLAHKAFVWGLYVAPEARTRGIGARLLRHALHHAATVLGVRQVNLGVNTRNLAATALYRKLGFVEYGLERGFMRVGGELHDQLLMVWPAPGAA